ncbi:hypothetical protein EG103P3_00031 [Enterococcus phage EG103P3]|nr:hypothetical protein EG103P3_00031 [Enterococcus phage EG103P3]
MREYSSRELWSVVNGKVVIPEAIADYLESFETANDPYMTARAVHCIAQVGFGHSPEDRHENKWKFSEDEEYNLNYRRMFGADRHKFDIIRAVLDGYLVHAPRMAVKLGNKFVKEVESNTSLNYFRDLSEYLSDTEVEVVLVDTPVFFSADQAERIVKATGGELVNLD